MLSCRMNDDRLLCLKNTGRTPLLNKLWSRMMKARPSSDHEIELLYSGVDRMAYNLLRNEGTFGWLLVSTEFRGDNIYKIIL